MLLGALVFLVPAHAKLTPEKINYWMRIHECEQPSSWRVSGTYQGGLGIYAGTWDTGARELGLLSRYPDADDAPPLVQMRVAEYGYRAHHWWWGCMRTIGKPL